MVGRQWQPCGRRDYYAPVEEMQYIPTSEAFPSSSDIAKDTWLQSLWAAREVIIETGSQALFTVGLLLLNLA